jgi:diguanylate cyclase (GGDEF)-like protein
MPGDRHTLPQSGGTPTPALSIRARLVMLALLAIAPLLLDRIRLVEAERSERMAVAAREALEIARRNIESQQEGLAAARAMLEVAARSYVAMGARPDGCDSLLSALVAGVRWIRTLSVARRDGRIVCSTSPRATGINLAEQSYFQGVEHTGEWTLSDYMVARRPRAPILMAALPAPAGGAFTGGVLVAGLDPQWIGRLETAVSGQRNAVALMVDGEGRIIASHPRIDDWIGSLIPDPALLAAMAAQPAGTLTTSGLDDVARVFGFLQVPGTSARILIGLAETEVLGRIERERRIAYGQLAVVGILVLFGVWYAGEHLIVRPIGALARSAGQIGEGDLDLRLANRAWAGEFAPLAQALDAMAYRLGAREEELRVANTHLEALSKIDSLTSLANRRGFDVELEAQLERSARLAQPLALLMIDVDYFKLYNDHYGHVEGDDCLRRIGEVIAAAAFEASYLAARYGGEEFALLLPETDRGAAIEAAAGLRRAVEDLAIAHAMTPSRRVTVSIGVAALAPYRDASAQMLIEAADQALYAAKRQGRNAVVADADIDNLVAG